MFIRIYNSHLITEVLPVRVFRVRAVVPVPVILAAIVRPVTVVEGELPRLIIGSFWIRQFCGASLHRYDQVGIASFLAFIVQKGTVKEKGRQIYLGHTQHSRNYIII